ncbi:MAG: hypothetical protein JXQ27_02275 [Acidobacteria bacterium]|nr:hypothetical protein [Acidobacteriota bacterium]
MTKPAKRTSPVGWVEIPAEVLALPLSEMELPPRTITLLLKGGVQTIGELFSRMESEPDTIAAIPQIGTRTMKGIRACLADFTVPTKAEPLSPSPLPGQPLQEAEVLLKLPESITETQTRKKLKKKAKNKAKDKEIAADKKNKKGKKDKKSKKDRKKKKTDGKKKK